MQELDPYFDHLRNRLISLKARLLLLNGNIEKILKALFANHIEGLTNFSYVMDKRFRSKDRRRATEVDLLVMDGVGGYLTFEFKCTLTTDPVNTRASAKKAVEQVLRHKFLEFQDMEPRGAFIIHFLNGSKFENSPLPKWIRDRFPKPKVPITVDELSMIYQLELERHNTKANSAQFNIIAKNILGNDCALDAVAVEIQWE